MMSRVFIFLISFLSTISVALSGSPTIDQTWDVRYKTLSPLGVPERVITINGQFPGPKINTTTNDNVVINVINNLDEPLLFTWNGVQLRKNSWQDGVLGTNCPIQPGTNYTYRFQVKDQIGSYYYYPSTSTHRAAGGYGPLVIHTRIVVPIPFPRPEDDYSIMVGDWYTKDPKDLAQMLQSGKLIGEPNGVIINGENEKSLFTMVPGKTYRYRICNAGLKNTINARFQNHTMKLVELDGSHTVQNVYDSLDIHLGQCYSVLVNANQEPKDYFLVVSTRFSEKERTAKATVRYKGGKGPASAALPPAPADGVNWSISQFRSLRWNLTASAARPNPQGSYHYGEIKITRTIKVAMNKAAMVDGKPVFAVNGVAHKDTNTPLKLAQHYGVGNKLFKYNLMGDEPPADSEKVIVAPNVINATFRNFIEIVFENHDDTMQSWHLAGYAFFAVGAEHGEWTAEKRNNYNLVDAVSRHTVQVYPGSWTAIMTTLDNAGLWNVRNLDLERQYLGEQFYINVAPDNKGDEQSMPENFIHCGIVKDLAEPKPSSD